MTLSVVIFSPLCQRSNGLMHHFVSAMCLALSETIEDLFLNSVQYFLRVLSLCIRNGILISLLESFRALNWYILSFHILF